MLGVENDTSQGNLKSDIRKYLIVLKKLIMRMMGYWLMKKNLQLLKVIYHQKIKRALNFLR